MAPVIAPFSFGQEALNAGDYVVIQCSVAKGDSPLSLHWYFQQRVLHSEPATEIAINRLGDRTLVLQISSVTAAHNGDYTCTAQNSAGISNFTATLSVNGILISFRQGNKSPYPLPVSEILFSTFALRLGSVKYTNILIKFRVKKNKKKQKTKQTKLLSELELNDSMDGFS